VGLGAAIDYVQALGHANITAHEKMLLDYATEKLSRINSLQFYGKAREKGAILSFAMANAHPHDVATVIDRYGGPRGDALRDPAFEALRLHRDLPGFLRALQYDRRD